MNQAMVSLTRTVRFSAGHRYYLDELSEAENRALYGACASPHGHGHDYLVEVTVGGRVDAKTGMVLNIAQLKPILQETIVAPWDGEFLTVDHPATGGLMPTTENLSRLAWRSVGQRVNAAFPDARLECVRIYESASLWSEARPGEEGEPVIDLTRSYEFATAHRLHSPVLSDEENRELFGKCNNPRGHGHNYKLEVTIRHPVDERTGLMADLASIDKIVNREVVDRYDHHHLNYDVAEFHELNPTSENIAVVIWNRLNGRLPGVELVQIRLCETERNSFTYRGEATS